MSATTTTPRPLVKAVTRRLTYLGARAVVLTEHHDKSHIGVRTITTEWLDDADPRNGGHKAGTVTRRVIKGDGRYIAGPKAFVEVEPERIISAAA